MGFRFRRFALLTLLAFTSAKLSAQPAVNISDTQVIEGNSGTTNAEFVITLSAPWTNAITISYTTFEVGYDYLNEPYPARSNEDFVATNGSVTFAPGETNKSVFVQVIGDTINEANEPFGLFISGPGIATPTARCVIVDDDPLEIEINDAQILEPPAGTTQYVEITMTTHQTTEQTVYGTFAIKSGTADASDCNIGYGPNSWTYNAGPPQTNVVIGAVFVYGDNVNEDDETCLIAASLGYGRPHAVQPKDTNPPNAHGVVFLNQATCTIINDDFNLNAQCMANNRTEITLYGASNATHVLQSSSDLINWTSFSTNTLDSTRHVSVTVTNSGSGFYRALRTLTVSQ